MQELGLKFILYTKGNHFFIDSFTKSTKTWTLKNKFEVDREMRWELKQRKPQELSFIGRNGIVDGPKLQVHGNPKKHQHHQTHQYFLAPTTTPHFLPLSLSLLFCDQTEDKHAGKNLASTTRKLGLNWAIAHDPILFAFCWVILFCTRKGLWTSPRFFYFKMTIIPLCTVARNNFLAFENPFQFLRIPTHTTQSYRTSPTVTPSLPF